MEIKHPLTLDRINPDNDEWPVWYVRDADGNCIAIMGQTDLAEYVRKEVAYHEE